MKVLLTCALLIGCSTAASAQTTTQDAPRHVPFASASANYTPGYKVSYSAEAGSWGTTSNTSYSGVLDVCPTEGKTDYWLGAKLYYTVHNEEKLCYMVYVAPKTNLRRSQGMLEYAFNPYYTLSGNALLGVTIGQQYTAEGTTTFGSLGLVYLFQ